MRPGGVAGAGLRHHRRPVSVVADRRRDRATLKVVGVGDRNKVEAATGAPGVVAAGRVGDER